MKCLLVLILWRTLTKPDWGAKSGSRNQILRISCSDLFENFWNCLSNEIQNANELFSLVKRALTDMTWH